MEPRHDSIKVRAATLGGSIGVLWFVRVLDMLVPGGGSAAGHGIIPRTLSGLDGVLYAPFIHSSFEHLAANTIPFAILGTLILLRGVLGFAFVVLVSGLVAGAGTWLFGAPGTEHVGASGIVFGFFGYLVFRTVFDRRWSSALITLVVAVLYGTAMASSLIPHAAISWSGHFFGFIGGVLAARWRYAGANRRGVPSESSRTTSSAIHRV